MLSAPDPAVSQETTPPNGGLSQQRSPNGSKEVSVLVVVLAARPLQVWKLGMATALTVAFFGAFALPGVNRFFDIEYRPSASVIAEGAAVGLAVRAPRRGVNGVTAVARRSRLAAGAATPNEPDALSAH